MADKAFFEQRALVDLRRADGSVVAANMYQPFPSATTPIWAVNSYRVGR